MKHFISIDEQGWYCHFRTSYRGWLYRPARWLLSLLRRSPWVAVINTYGISDGKTVFNLDNQRLDRHFGKDDSDN